VSNSSLSNPRCTMPTKWLRQLRHEFGPLGVEVRHGSKHLRLELPTGRTLAASSTPSDYRAIYKVRAEVKRALRASISSQDIVEAPFAEPVKVLPQIEEVPASEPNVIIERTGIVEPPRIVMADVVYSHTSSAHLPLILLSGELAPKRNEVLWATTEEDGGRLFSPTFYYHEMYKKRYMRAIRFTCNSNDFCTGDGWRKIVKKPGVYWRKAKEVGQSMKSFRYRTSPLNIDDTLIEMRTYGGSWVPVEHFSIIDVPIPGITAIKLDDLIYISKRVSPDGIAFRPPISYDMLPFIVNTINPKTYEEAAAKYTAVDNKLAL
jgi:hypothetical protein